MTRTLAVAAIALLFGLLALACGNPAPTQAEKDAVRIEDWKPQGGTLFPAKVLHNYRPLLRMDKNVGIRPLQVETVKNANGGFITTMWARRADASIVVDWGNKTVAKGNVDNIKSVGGPSPEYVPPGMLMGGAGDSLLVKLSDSQHFKLPWARNSDVYPLALDADYQYAFGSELTHSSANGGRGSIDSVVVVDTVNKTVLGTVPVPPVKTTLHVIFEPKEGYLMVFDYDSEWIMLLDLRKPPGSEVKTPGQKGL